MPKHKYLLESLSVASQIDYRKIPLHDHHVLLGAKMIPFAGFYMPLRYTSDIEEHNTVRNSVGIFDVSHMGEFIIEGEHAESFLQKITTNDVSALTVYKAQYTCMTNESGGIIDDIILYKTGEHAYMVVVNASNIEKDWRWMNTHKTDRVIIRNISETICLFAVQGPQALNCLQKLTAYNLSSIPYYSFAHITLAGIKDIFISNTGYTGSGGFEVFVHNKHALVVWQSIIQAGEEYGIKPIGLAARDTLRLEMGYCLYGNDIDENTTPIEAGLSWITKFNKNFIGIGICNEQKRKGTHNTLCGFVMVEQGVPRSGYKILNNNKEEIGRVTSGTQSPSLKKGIGMGYIKTEEAIPGNEIFIQIRDYPLKAIIKKPPFYKP